MNNWTKKPVTKQQIEPLCSKYNIDQLLASIFIRRNITEGNDILYFLEDDLRFQHSPFLFSAMEDCVERIIQAKEENEKILIFGDSDVDGITSTTILYDTLEKLGIDVQWRLPLADDAYGLSIAAIDDFYQQGGSLIITVDCGISNYDEIEHANELGIEVIVTDHHNPPENLPDAILILDPKTQDSGYPFPDISGAAVAYKLVSALRFSQTDFYNAEICFLNIEKDESSGAYNVDCLKIRNLVKIKELHEKIIPGRTTIYDLKLPYFLQGQLIHVWDSNKTQEILKEVFGSNIQFNLIDFKKEVSRVIPTLSRKNANELKSLSKIAKYKEEENTLLNSLYNLYVTYTNKMIDAKYPDNQVSEKRDLQLVGLAALADIMPMKNENRLFVKNCIDSFKKDRPRSGLAELCSLLKINTDFLTSTDLSWSIIPALNATGRLGQPDVALKLLLSKDPKERDILAHQIIDLNEARKEKVSSAIFRIHDEAEESIKKYDGKLCVVIDKTVDHGLTGLFANRLMQDFNVPAIAITYCDQICIGSIRSCRGFIATDFLNSFGDFFLNHGGHNYAAGFSFTKDKLEQFLQIIRNSLPQINLAEENGDTEVDAEIPVNFMNNEMFRLIDIFEPYGAENPELVFMTSKIIVEDAMIVGKKEPSSLKMTLDCGEIKVPGMFWNKGNRLGTDIFKNESYDILYSMSKNIFNGKTTNQFIIKEVKK